MWNGRSSRRFRRKRGQEGDEFITYWGPSPNDWGDGTEQRFVSMITVRKAGARGQTKLSWLDSRHSFSFGDYVDPKATPFRALLVLNEDRIAPGRGFPTHGHRDIEILSYIVSGTLEAEDSSGTRSLLGPGALQRITAGTGIQHSGFNPSTTDLLHMFQIWIAPETRGLPPSQQDLPPSSSGERKIRLIAAPEGGARCVTVRQDVRLHEGSIDQQTPVQHPLSERRYAWVQVIRGELLINGKALEEGDAASISNEAGLAFETPRESAFLLFDLA